MKQCKACPWKKSTVASRDIPNGYSTKKHKKLKCTIADPERLSLGPVHMMACHDSPKGEERPCVGWVIHQLGPGNNIALRLRAITGEFKDYRVEGPQHKWFEDTLT
jgi:hypothetical protein